MIVFIVGMPRSGSMWTYNVARELLSRSNKTVLPEKIPPDEEDLIDEALNTDLKYDEVYCIKTHGLINPNIPGIKIICTYRDIREAVVSYMEFVKCSFDQALEMARSMMKAIDFYFEMRHDNILRISYDDIISQPLQIIEDISSFIELETSSGNLQDIHQQFSKTQVTELIDSLNKITLSSNGELEDSKYRSDYEAVQNKDGTYRVYHKHSAFQTKHITGKGDQWREILDEKQKKKLNKLSKSWLKKYGFKI